MFRAKRTTTTLTVAKNYLHDDEITELNRIVTMLLDFADDQGRRQVFMRDWRERLDDFLRFNDRNDLPDQGHASREDADRRAAKRYELFHRQRLAEADAKAEADTMKQLEEMAKTPHKKKGKKDQGKV